MASTKKQTRSVKATKELMTMLWDPVFAVDPLAFVLFAFPWGKPGTPLEHWQGPKKWQRKILQELSEHIKSNKVKRATGNDLELWRKAVSSGHGIGKSALISWIIIWFLTTRPGAVAVVSANNEHQLKGRTWAELKKWVTLSINSDWWEMLAMEMRPAAWYAESLADLKIDSAYYYAKAQLWSEENPDAFAGAHNHYGVLLVFDEASGIPSVIWDVCNGYFSDQVEEGYQFAFSNPRRNSGKFFECFHKNREFWRTEKIDTRTVEGIDLGQAEKLRKEYGEDSAQFRVQVMGEFPLSDTSQFISRLLVQEAMSRETYIDSGAPLLMGVDVAAPSTGGRSVIAFRRGYDAKSIPWYSSKTDDTVQLARKVAEFIDKYHVTKVFVDGNGFGRGVYDNLKAWGYGDKIINVMAGSQRNCDTDRYKNKRAEMWDLLKKWLEMGTIPQDDLLIDDLTACSYKHDVNTGALLLESKEAMRERGIASPDKADALAMTFAAPVARTDIQSRDRRQTKRRLVKRYSALEYAAR